MLYVAPESLTKQENVDLLREIKISFYAVDEAHCISEWGHDFRPEYRRIRPIVDEIGTAPIIALTATATPKVQSDILKNLKMTDAKVFKASFNRPNLYYEVRDKINPKKDIVKFIRQHPRQSGIIYCLSRKKVEELAFFLSINDVRALPYHAGLPSEVRSENQDRFLNEEVDVIVATIAFGMGIDKPDVRFVIHYDITKSLEGYYQETGRAGRDGKEGICITYYSEKDIQKLEKFMQGKPVSEQEIGRQLLSETMGYAEMSQCRRKMLLNYFGEDYPYDNCGNCDNCLHPRKRFDARKEVKLVIELIKSLPEHFKIEHLAAILAGVGNAMIKSYNHAKLPLFGIGKDKTPKFWASVIHQCVVLHLLEKDIESYGQISVTDEGLKLAQTNQPLMHEEDRPFSNNDEDEDEYGTPRPGTGDSGDPVLLAMLKDLRKDMARRKGLQPWIIFSDQSLEDMSIFYPFTTTELTHCQGVGEGKAKKYGADFLALIKKYVEENEIERPEDLVIRSVPSSADQKVKIIQAIDRKQPLEDIAAEQGKDLLELINELESIVYSGTKLKLGYAVSEMMDEDDVREIYDYFRNAETDHIENALEELGDVYTEEELRLVRLKFICEVAN